MKKVYIVGTQQLQNSLLAKYLGKVLDDIQFEEIKTVSAVESVTDETMFLVDSASVDLEMTLRTVENIGRESSALVHLAIFNIDDEEDLGRYASRPYVNGAFQRSTPQENLAKGISAMFDGEIWLPRKVLSQFLQKNRSFNNDFTVANSNLTEREVEVLKVMATGAKNTEIAEQLNLSPHTIKTHIYNIFKKINASNRLQAVNWAQQNL